MDIQNTTDGSVVTTLASTPTALSSPSTGSEANASEVVVDSAVDETNPSAAKVLKTAVKLTPDQRKQIRAQKFGDTKASPQSTTAVDQNLQKRAQRFGTVVSEKLKKVEDSQKLMKRKERFGAITSTETSSKRKTISSPSVNKDQLEKRIARFGKV